MDKLTEQSKLLIRILLTDSKISEKVFENSTDKSKYKICSIREDGAIIMGKTSIRWWNQLINAQDVFTFESFALKVWDTLVDLSSGLNNTAILKGLSQEIVMNAVREKRYDYVVNRLFDCWKHVAQNSDGYQKPEAPEGARRNGQGRRVEYPDSAPHEIIINIDGHRKAIPLVDSNGDSMRLRAEVGIVGIYPSND